MSAFRFFSGVAVVMCLADAGAGTFAFKEEGSTTGALTITDEGVPVLTYRYGDQLKAGVDASYRRSDYIHPLYSLDGKEMTEDFPVDHLHHRGLSWTWPHIETRSTVTQTWAPGSPELRQVFSRWVERTVTNDDGATLTVESNWVLAGRETVARELVTLRVHGVKDNERRIEVRLELEAVGGPLKLQGTKEGNKGYGGFAIRMAPRFKGARLTTSAGPQDKDVVNVPLEWADLWDGTDGLTVSVDKGHPDFPPHWMARNSYAGFMNVSWPGLEGVTIGPGKPVRLEYGLRVHGRAARAAGPLEL